MKLKPTAKTTTLTAAAAALGKTKQALSRTLKRHNIIPDANGRFDAAKVFEAAKTGALRDKARVASGTVQGDDIYRRKVEQQIRHLTIQADRADFELKKATGGYISKEDCHKRMLALATACRRTIDVWIKTTSNAVGSVAMKHKLEDARRQAFEVVQREFEEAQNANQITE